MNGSAAQPTGDDARWAGATTRSIDLNADLGENVGDDLALLEIVTSASVACGAHAGDAATMRRTCAQAAERGVAIGAHPSYADREGFGRRALEVGPAVLATSLAAQYAALASAASSAGATIRFVKPHGALYHRAAHDPMVAEAVYREAVTLDPCLRFLAPPGSILLRHARAAGHGVRGVVEGFADRAYGLGALDEVVLVGREQPGAILEHDAAVAQAVALATTGLATTESGEPVAVYPRSLCVHGDTPGAVALAREIRTELERAGVAIEAFAP